MGALFKVSRERGIKCDRGSTLEMAFAAAAAVGDRAPSDPGLQPVRLRDSFPNAMESTRACTYKISG
jgi:hypothetical protein